MDDVDKTYSVVLDYNVDSFDMDNVDVVVGQNALDFVVDLVVVAAAVVVVVVAVAVVVVENA